MMCSLPLISVNLSDNEIPDASTDGTLYEKLAELPMMFVQLVDLNLAGVCLPVKCLHII
jgi:hypothetical protein